MDIGKSLQFVLEDDRWTTKLGLGALISIIPILNFAWVGYIVDLMRNVSDQKELPLPEWDDFGDKFMKGLIVSVAMFLYAIPGVIFLCLPVAIMMIPAFFQNEKVQGGLAAATTLAGLALICCIGLFFLALTLILPAIQLRFSRLGTFQSCFQLREVYNTITERPGEYFTAWLITVAAGFIISMIVGVVSVLVGWILCLGQILAWVVSAVASAWVGTIYAHLFGQLGVKLARADENLPLPSEGSGD